MITKYKVIEPFGVLKPGDVLLANNDMYVFSDRTSSDKGDYTSETYVEISKEMVNDYVKSGLLEPINNEPNCKKCDKINKLCNLINQLKNTYNQRKNNIDKKYKEGKIQTCVKVEHDTVYFNLMKLLNKIESIVNE